MKYLLFLISSTSSTKLCFEIEKTNCSVVVDYKFKKNKKDQLIILSALINEYIILKYTL
jgi:hypothetical protein